MEEAIGVTVQITNVLEKLGIEYLVGGSLASSLHGLPRATQDVDVVAHLRPEHVSALVDALREDFYLDESAIRDAVATRSTFNVIHLFTMFKADIFVAGADDVIRREMERREPFQLEGEPSRQIIVASPEDIIVQKLHWYRLGDHVSDRQWLDALGVLRVRGKDLDRAYMREVALRLDVSDLLERALLEAGLSAPEP
ncbi:MAG TPA: hypothetical protein VF665_01335 [Longimicrobium sp.]|uniref:hypothetical protein n=1 Tax=Longimicrobium sp. TaxID=2029185 RepID=UPI002EDA3521